MKQFLSLLFVSSIAVAPASGATQLTTAQKIKKYGIATAKFTGAGAAIIVFVTGLYAAQRGFALKGKMKRIDGTKTTPTLENIWIGYHLCAITTAATTAFFWIKSGIEDLKNKE